MHMKIEPVAGWSFGIPGKSLLNTECRQPAKGLYHAPFSDFHDAEPKSQDSRQSEGDISNPVFAEAKRSVDDMGEKLPCLADG